MTEETIIIGQAQIELKKNAKNQYSWNIKLPGNELKEISKEVIEINNILLEEFGIE